MEFESEVDTIGLDGFELLSEKAATHEEPPKRREPRRSQDVQGRRGQCPAAVPVWYTL